MKVSYNFGQISKQMISILILIGVDVLCLNAQSTEPKTVRLFYLGGQSNMDGFGQNQDLPENLKGTSQSTYIFHGNPASDGDSSGGLGIWEKLTPGHGRGFSSDGNTSQLGERFGPELSFSKRMEKAFPGDIIAIIKYSRGGSSLDSTIARQFGCWDEEFEGAQNQYDFFLRTLSKALERSDIDEDGMDDLWLPTGIVWMQGESDGAFSEKIAIDYYDNLSRLMDLIRASLRVDDLPVVIGRISDSGNIEGGKVWPYGDLVQYAQEKYAKNDINAAIVRTTKDYGYSDRWHYDSASYIDLGEQFAKKLLLLIDSTH